LSNRLAQDRHITIPACIGNQDRYLSTSRFPMQAGRRCAKHLPN